MRYLGSKRLLAKYILPIILKGRHPNQIYIEPFCGGCNSIDRVSGPRIANDINDSVIALFKEVVDEGWIPPENVSNEEYTAGKMNPQNYPAHYRAFVLICCSFGAKWAGGYARSKKTSRNFASEGKRNLLKQREKLQGVQFFTGSYDDLPMPPGQHLIYCDPPYKSTTKYGTIDLNHDNFFDWCREKRDEGHDIFISELDAPSDFKCVWEKEHGCHIQQTSTKKYVEKLYTLEKNF